MFKIEEDGSLILNRELNAIIRINKKLGKIPMNPKE